MGKHSMTTIRSSAAPIGLRPLLIDPLSRRGVALAKHVRPGIEPRGKDVEVGERPNEDAVDATAPRRPDKHNRVDLLDEGHFRSIMKWTSPKILVKF
jgi:hypothetical protein